MPTFDEIYLAARLSGMAVRLARAGGPINATPTGRDLATVCRGREDHHKNRVTSCARGT
jgi:hypothetical protein